MYSPPSRHHYPDAIITPYHRPSCGLMLASATAPASGTWGTSSCAVFYPVRLEEPFVVAKAFIINGATVGTDSWDLGIYRMTDQGTGRCDLIRSTGAVLSAGTANQGAETATWKIAAANITSGNDSTDSATYTTDSVVLKAGKLYLMSVVNTAADAAVLSDVTGGPTFTSRSTQQFNTTGHRVSVWSAVPTTDYSGTLVITFGATQTSATWSLNEFTGVDTATNDGIVQQVPASGSSVSPSSTLAAFGSASNATFGAMGNTTDTTTAPGSGFTELSDTNAATPAACLQTQWRVDNDTTVDATISNNPWGVCALELKASTSPLVIPASAVGPPDIYMALSIGGTTATIFRSTAPSLAAERSAGMLQKTATFPLPSTVIPGELTATRPVALAGFSSRTLFA